MMVVPEILFIILVIIIISRVFKRRRNTSNFNQVFKLMERKLSRINLELTRLNKRYGNLIFNRLTIDDAKYFLDSCRSDYIAWQKSLENLDIKIKTMIFSKCKAKIFNVEKLFQTIDYKTNKLDKISRIKTNQKDKYLSPNTLKEDQPIVCRDFNGTIKLRNPEGIVESFRQETEQKRSIINTARKIHSRLLDPIFGRLDPPTKKITMVYKFNLIFFYSDKNLTISIPIKMRGQRLKGDIANGDEVALTGIWKWNAGETIEIREIVNKSINKKVKVVGKSVLVY